jgi:hypothetical protein
VTLPLCANVGSGSNFKAMNGDDPRAERGVCKDADELRRTTGVEVGEAAGLRGCARAGKVRYPEKLASEVKP